jgi:tetratricopeptide (TPR) repeat protein
MPTLSLAMIVKNEAPVLGHCLASVRDLVDEIVVVDTGSTDDTVAIAEAHGARIGHFPWRDDFAAARNESLGLCGGDWVLLLDADEAIDPMDHGVVRAAVAEASTKGSPAAYTLVCRNYTRDASARLFDQPVVPNRSSYAEGAGLPFHADLPLLRLVRRFPGLRFEGRIHELLDPCLVRKKLPIGQLGAVIHHYGKVDPEREKAKSAYYLALAERDAAEHPADLDRQFNLMAQAYAAGRWEQALAAGWAVIRGGGQAGRGVPHAARTTVAMACQQLGRHQEALAPLQEVLRIEPGHPLALCRLPLSLAALGRGEEGRPYLARAMRSHPEDPVPHVVLAEIEERGGRLPQAREALLAAIARDPMAARLRQGLVELDLRHGLEAQAAADALEALRALPGQGEGHWHALAASFLLRSGHARPGKAVLDLGLAAFPEHPGLCALAAAIMA